MHSWIQWRKEHRLAGLGFYGGPSGENLYRFAPKLIGLITLQTGLLLLGSKILLPASFHRYLSGIANLAPLSAFGLIVLGFAVRMARWETLPVRASRFARVFRLLVAALGAVSVAAHLAAAAGATPWMAAELTGLPLPAGLCLSLIGTSMILTKGHRAHGAVVALLAASALIAVSAMLARGYPLSLGAGEAGWLHCDPVTALLALLCSLSLLFTSANQATVSAVTSGSAGGAMARRLLVLACVLPILVGWVRLVAERKFQLHPDLGLLLHVVASICLMFAAGYWNFMALAKATENRDSMALTLADTHSAYLAILGYVENVVYAYDTSCRVTYLNAAASKAFGVEAPLTNSFPLGALLGEEAASVSLAALLDGHGVGNQSRWTQLSVNNGRVEPFPLQVMQRLQFRQHKIDEIVVVGRTPCPAYTERSSVAA